jgi:hypothetical protein
MALKRFEFNEIFQELSDGSLQLKQPLEIGKTKYQKDTIFNKGVIYGGIDFDLYRDHGIAIELEDNSEGPLKLYGFYPN